MIIVVAIVALESEDSWAWFLEHIKANFNLSLAFVIFYRDKGLTLAVARTFTWVPHFFCSHYLIENFIARFKNRELKRKSWSTAKTENEVQSEYATTTMRNLNPELIECFEAICFDKIAMIYNIV